MDLTSFHTALLTMVLLERQELIEAGAIGESDHHAWATFQCDPARWLLVPDHKTATAVWKAIWRRRALVVGIEPTAEVVEFKRKRIVGR